MTDIIPMDGLFFRGPGPWTMPSIDPKRIVASIEPDVDGVLGLRVRRREVEGEK